MEITLEKIELVKDRTGVSYKEAKEALEANNGDVVEAIISIEDAIDAQNRSGLGETVSVLTDKVKEAVKKGNVAKILITKDGNTILNLPVNVGLIGVCIAPWVAVAGVLTAYGTKCKIELVKTSGDVVNVNDVAEKKLEGVKSKTDDFCAVAKEVGSELYSDIKERLKKEDSDK